MAHPGAFAFSKVVRGDRVELRSTRHPRATVPTWTIYTLVILRQWSSSAKRKTLNEGPAHLVSATAEACECTDPSVRKSADLTMTTVGGSESDDYCLITVPSRFRISPHPPFRLSGPDTNGSLAAAFSSISIPHPGCSFTHRYPSFISGQP